MNNYSDDEDDFDNFYDDFMSDEDEYYDDRPVNHRPEDLEKIKLNNLFYAIMRGDIENVTKSLNEGIDVNVSFEDNWKPILLAASIGEHAIVKELIDRGADVNSEIDKYTTLMAACYCPLSTSACENSAQVVRFLIDYGANANAITRKRMTALMYAAASGNTEIIPILLPICDKNAEDNQGWTALFWAVNDRHPEAVKLLLEAGLDPEKTDVRSNKPFYYATMNESYKIMELLPSEKKNQEIIFANCSYDVEEEFSTLCDDSKRPYFFRDVCLILHGMQSENFMNLFLERKVDLLNFLSLNEQKLIEMGISLPYQRNRIMEGLYKFHKHSFSTKSLPIIAKKQIYSTVDLANSLISAVRQITTMEAAIRFIKHQISPNILNTLDDEIEYNLFKVKSKIKRMKKITNTLLEKSKQWEEITKPADLITKDSIKKKKTYKKWIAFCGIVTFTAVLVLKINRS